MSAKRPSAWKLLTERGIPFRISFSLSGTGQPLDQLQRGSAYARNDNAKSRAKSSKTDYGMNYEEEEEEPAESEVELDTDLWYELGL